MELKQIKELMAAMGRTGTKRLSLKKEGFELMLEREANTVCSEGALDLTDEAPLDQTKRANIAFSRAKENEAPLSGAPAKTEETGTYITSPMVGTFYAAASPDDPPFVKVGDKVDKNSVVCIIEAMKVMNEVKANVTGTVAELLVDSGHPVEFGTKLFKVT